MRIFFIRLILLVSVSIILLSTAAGTVINCAGVGTGLLYNEASSGKLTKLGSDSYAVRFNSATEIAGTEIFIGKASGTDNGVTLALYKWEGSFWDTTKVSPLCEKRFENPESGAWLGLDYKGDPGEYIIIIDNAVGNIQIFTDTETVENAVIYLNCSRLAGSVRARVIFEGGNGILEKPTEETVRFVTSQDTWVATDGLGRTVSNSYTDTTRENKTVGLFFHTWHDSNSRAGTRNITEILKEHPEIKNDYSSTLWGSSGNYHWNEPIWGYYKTSDEWVLRRQAELLADAGVDVVIFDNTNGTVTFIDSVLTLLRVWSRARADGVKTPRISFMLPMFDYEAAAVQLREIYQKLYGAGLYEDLWFYWKGKPLIVGYPGRLDAGDSTDAEIINFFNYRVISHSQSEDNIQVQDDDGTPLVYGATPTEVTDNYQLWNWISVWPQLVNRNPDGSPEEVAVAVAHNWCAETHLTAMNNSKYNVFGRHYSPSKGEYDTRENAKLYGQYFSEQWDYAIDVDPEFIWITGWNEGVAGRYEDFWGVENAFPDNFSDEFSRDIEPSKGDLKDHYYYQMCAYIRKYKGTSATPLGEYATINMSTGDGWENVKNVYESYGGDTFDRDSNGYINSANHKYYYYSDSTGRNDIVSGKACYDDNYIYFLVETKDNLTPYTDNAWMRLLLEVQSVDGVSVDADNWESFQYIVNRNVLTSADKAVLEKSTGGWNWETVGEIDYNTSENRLWMRIPKSMLGITGNTFVLNFKWSDNMQDDGDIMDFYVHGDTAPEGRFKYQLAVGVSVSNDNKKKRGCSGSVIGGAPVSLIAAGASAAVFCKRRRRKAGNAL